METNIIAKGVILMGLMLLFMGILLTLAPRIPFFGRLPGDFVFSTGNVQVFFPLATMLLLSVILTLLLNLFVRH
jgi:hypothetical protein